MQLKPVRALKRLRRCQLPCRFPDATQAREGIETTLVTSGAGAFGDATQAREGIETDQSIGKIRVCERCNSSP